MSGERFFAFVDCDAGCGTVGLSKEEYERQLSRPNSLWRCCKCGDSAEYNDELSEAAQEIWRGMEIQLDQHTEEALDALDAAFFTGDKFLDEDGICRAKYFLDRWTRQIASNVSALEAKEKDAATEEVPEVADNSEGGIT